MSSRMCAFFSFVAGVTSFAAVSSAVVTVVDGPIQSPVNGHYYSVLSNTNWTDAQTAAQGLGGNLATVRSSAEETWIEQTFSAYPFLWLGLYDPTQNDFGSSHAQHFVWIDRESVTYTNWGKNEPNDFNGEYWTQLVLTSSSTEPPDKWNDITNDADPQHVPNFYGPVYGLAEVVPEPASLGLVTLVSLVLVMRRVRGDKRFNGDGIEPRGNQRDSV